MGHFPHNTRPKMSDVVRGRKAIAASEARGEDFVLDPVIITAHAVRRAGERGVAMNHLFDSSRSEARKKRNVVVTAVPQSWPGKQSTAIKEVKFSVPTADVLNTSYRATIAVKEPGRYIGKGGAMIKLLQKEAAASRMRVHLNAEGKLSVYGPTEESVSSFCRRIVNDICTFKKPDDETYVFLHASVFATKQRYDENNDGRTIIIH